MDSDGFDKRTTIEMTPTTSTTTTTTTEDNNMNGDDDDDDNSHIHLATQEPLYAGQVIEGPDGLMVLVRLENSDEFYAVPCTTDECGNIMIVDDK